MIERIPVGYTLVDYRGKTYGLSRTDFNGEKSVKVFARELGGADFVSFNFYRTRGGDKLKPCEMPAEKVTDFLENWEAGV